MVEQASLPQVVHEQERAVRWKTYAEYKDSGVEWLGEIPSHWEMWKIAHAFKDIGSGTTPLSTKEEYYLEGSIPWVNTSELRDNLIYETTKKITTKALLEVQALRLYSPQTLLIAMYGATIGRIGILKIAATVNQACCALSGSSKIDIKFLFYWFLAYKQHIVAQADGGGQPNINQEIIRSLRVPTPLHMEQQIIASFLDRETTRINALIAKKEQHIALLQERRTAIINQAVTKGLNADMPMKDSGVEWLGEIPEHWEMRRLKFLADTLPGATKGKDLIGRKTVNLPYLRVANVQDGYLDLSDVETITVGIDEVGRYSLKSGDVLMNEGGDFDKLGRGFVWDGSIDPCLHQNHVFAVRPFSVHDSNWINMITQTSYAKHYFILKSKQSTNLASISKTNIQNIPVILPPTKERLSILAYLEQETTKIDKLITGIQESIKKLKEYSTALISAAVTGKIDVRGEVAAGSAEDATI